MDRSLRKKPTHEDCGQRFEGARQEVSHIHVIFVTPHVLGRVTWLKFRVLEC